MSLNMLVIIKKVNGLYLLLFVKSQKFLDVWKIEDKVK